MAWGEKSSSLMGGSQTDSINDEQESPVDPSPIKRIV